MTLKTALAVLALSLAPGLALAQGGCIHQQQSASQCAAGQVWDAATQTCQPIASS